MNTHVTRARRIPVFRRRSLSREDRLAASVRRGITQYAVLGAGFDTFVPRQPAWAHSLQIFEVDRLATQVAKRSRIAAARLVAPTDVNFVNIGFEHESLPDDLCGHQVLHQPTFFSWLGVTMYLKEDAIDLMLGSVARFSKETEIDAEGGTVSLLAERVASVGEPFVRYFTPDAMEQSCSAPAFPK